MLQMVKKDKVIGQRWSSLGMRFGMRLEMVEFRYQFIDGYIQVHVRDGDVYVLSQRVMFRYEVGNGWFQVLGQRWLSLGMRLEMFSLGMRLEMFSFGVKLEMVSLDMRLEVVTLRYQVLRNGSFQVLGQRGLSLGIK